MRERSEILKSKSEVLHHAGIVGPARLPTDRLGRAASVEATGGAAAVASGPAGFTTAAAVSPEGLPPAWFGY